MNLNYSQSTGCVTDDNGMNIAIGWAGHGEAKNNPAMQGEQNLGPLPRGVYKVLPWEERHPGLGPMVARILQVSGETYGRSGFFIHGPSLDKAKYGQESKGCIVVPRSDREKIKALNPSTITVTI